MYKLEYILYGKVQCLNEINNKGITNLRIKNKAFNKKSSNSTSYNQKNYKCILFKK